MANQCEFVKNLIESLMDEFGPHFGIDWDAKKIYAKEMRKHRIECCKCEMDWENDKDDRRKKRRRA